MRALLACALMVVAATPALATADLGQGKATAERWCSSCHAVGATGPAPDTAPSFSHIAQTRNEAFLRGFLTNPHPPMPRFQISRQDIDDLIAYIQTQRTN